MHGAAVLLAGPLCRSAGRRPPDHPKPVRHCIWRRGRAGAGANSRQKYLYVPEPQNDFIFSILCEELGFVGAALTVVLFLLLFLRGMSIAVRARDKFGALLAVGFVVQVVLQAVLNIAVVTNTIPNTGISLPFFSSGGTSLMMLLGRNGHCALRFAPGGRPVTGMCKFCDGDFTLSAVLRY